LKKVEFISFKIINIVLLMKRKKTKMKVKFKKKLKTKMKIKQKVIKNLNAPTEILSKYITYKNNIKNICINKSVLNILNDICYRTNCIVRNTYYFIRHFYAYCF